MRGIYRSTSLCLLSVFGIAGAGQVSWEELIGRSDELSGQGKFGEAETTLLSALRVAEVFPLPDLRLAETQHRLGTVYRELGRLPEAETWYQRSLSAWKMSEPGLPKPLISLASLYLENGFHGKAERLIDPWLSDPEFKLDPTDSLSISLLQNFAALKYSQRRYSEAETLYRRALRAVETAFGPQSLEMAYLLNNLGILLAQTKRSKEAGSHLERALAIRESALPPDHTDVARSLNNLAAFYRSIRNYAKAEPLFQRALTIAERNLGSENRLVGTILTQYAQLLRKTKRKEEAKVLETRARAVRQGHTGQDLGRHTVDFRDLVASKAGPAREGR
jgi:tetratricopeptide (TPR) repeat protein